MDIKVEGPGAIPEYATDGAAGADLRALAETSCSSPERAPRWPPACACRSRPATSASSGRAAASPSATASTPWPA